MTLVYDACKERLLGQLSTLLLVFTTPVNSNPPLTLLPDRCDRFNWRRHFPGGGISDVRYNRSGVDTTFSPILVFEEDLDT